MCKKQPEISCEKHILISDAAEEIFNDVCHRITAILFGDQQDSAIGFIRLALQKEV
ncbi:MAG TPA: hypothetical protein PLP42_12860 [Acidobacteriota bacterium]|nr:hypothetical protein [Acidobacteriota bacterium]